MISFNEYYTTLDNKLKKVSSVHSNPFDSDIFLDSKVGNIGCDFWH